MREKWSYQEIPLLYLISKLSGNDILPNCVDSSANLLSSPKWMESIISSIKDFGDHLLYNAATLDTEGHQGDARLLSVIWYKLDVIPSLVAKKDTPLTLPIVLHGLILALNAHCVSRGYERGYVAIFGQCLSISSKLGLQLEEVPWEFVCHALSNANDMVTLVHGLYELLKACERY